MYRICEAGHPGVRSMASRVTRSRIPGVIAPSVPPKSFQHRLRIRALRYYRATETSVSVAISGPPPCKALSEHTIYLFGFPRSSFFCECFFLGAAKLLVRKCALGMPWVRQGLLTRGSAAALTVSIALMPGPRCSLPLGMSL